MPINKDIVSRTLNGQDRPDKPEVTIPDVLLIFHSNESRDREVLTVWNSIHVDDLRSFLSLSRDGSVDGGIEFHFILGNHIAEILPYVTQMSYLLSRDPDASQAEKDLFQNVQHNLLSVRMELIPQATPGPIRLQLNLSRKAKKNKSEGKARKAPSTTMGIAIPFLELINGVMTQEFLEEELFGVIGEITGYSRANIATYRRNKLSSVQRKELVGILNDMIHSING